MIECWIGEAQQLVPPLVDHIYTVRLGPVPKSVFQSLRVCASDAPWTAITPLVRLHATKRETVWRYCIIGKVLPGLSRLELGCTRETTCAA